MREFKIAILSEIEHTRMPKSYKMGVFLCMPLSLLASGSIALLEPISGNGLRGVCGNTS